MIRKITTTSNCAEIQFKTGHNRYMMIQTNIKIKKKCLFQKSTVQASQCILDRSPKHSTLELFFQWLSASHLRIYSIRLCEEKGWNIFICLFYFMILDKDNEQI